MFQLSFSSPIGPLTLVQDGEDITRLLWQSPGNGKGSLELFRAKEQINNYFKGTRKNFSLSLRPYGTKFQNRVWSVLMAIPYGKVKTYGEVARKLKTSPRAIGNACGQNPIPLIIPCHRVVGASGSLTGYSGGDGLKTKAFLLEHENSQRRLVKWTL
ncbi:MAG: methylated-DNA--[protein]-cysteine S-methyltransferase [Pseudomonadota bacterium]|nr:methylated-DNA--[protein]-cysteine S-methyltransferase [Pseudomonadota bacterium]